MNILQESVVRKIYSGLESEFYLNNRNCVFIQYGVDSYDSLKFGFSDSINYVVNQSLNNGDINALYAMLGIRVSFVESGKLISYPEFFKKLEKSFKNAIECRTIPNWIPDVEDQCEIFSQGLEESLIKRINENFYTYFYAISLNSKLQKRKINSLINVSYYFKEREKFLSSLEQEIESILERYKKFTEGDLENIHRQLDGLLYIYYENLPSKLSQKFFIFLEDILNLEKRKGGFVLLFRGLRHSYAKGIFLHNLYKDKFIKFVKETGTPDANTFLLICYANIFRNTWEETSDNYIEICDGILNIFLKTPEKEMSELLKDIRRFSIKTVKSSNLISDYLFDKSIARNQLKGKSLLTFLYLLSYVFGVLPKLLYKVYEDLYTFEIKLDDYEKLLAINGFDFLFLNKANLRIKKYSDQHSLYLPSGYQEIKHFMRACLNDWRGGVKKTSDELVSVITTTHNPDIELFQLSVESIMKQNNVNIQLIVVDDLSDDEYSKKIKKVLSSFSGCGEIEYYKNKKNIGQYSSRNFAINKAKGNYIAIQDDDDISHPDRLRLQVDRLKNNPNCLACHTLHLRISAESNLMLDGNSIFSIYGDAPVSFVWRKKVFDEIGGFLAVKTRGDIEFRQRMQQFYGGSSIAVIDAPLVYMRGAMSTISSSKEYSHKNALSLFRKMMVNKVFVNINNINDSKKCIPFCFE